MADSLLEKATSVLSEAKETITASAQTANTDAVKYAVNNVVTRSIDGAKSLLHDLEESKGDVLGAVSHFTGGGDSTDSQPLLAASDPEVETATPWWKSCCGVLDLLMTLSPSAK